MAPTVVERAPCSDERAVATPGGVGDVLAAALRRLSVSAASAAVAVQRRSAAARVRRRDRPPRRAAPLAETLAVGLGCDAVAERARRRARR